MNRLPRLPKEVDDLGTTETTSKKQSFEENDEEDTNSSSGDEDSQADRGPDSSHSASTPIPISSQSLKKPLLSSKVESLGFSTTEGEGTLQSIVSPRVFLPLDSREEQGSFVSSKTEQELSESFDWAGSFMESEPLFTQKQQNSRGTLDR
ncbi:hypothetical protein GpartN1_g3342.t1 [Galdieria partita]|uniref:Uncharacterized protein n=1 Tax=Galdieria partita TaxID=83374 RepID=A0A9C7PQZ9_9RHOD|nr:hypothetical protein GpartN1_g834.t1 [Galdieria partita]GJQ11551.1 hypothetical protein GpartN1_g3342.t1 [Galdieria partita]